MLCDCWDVWVLFSYVLVLIDVFVVVVDGVFGLDMVQVFSGVDIVGDDFFGVMQWIIWWLQVVWLIVCDLNVELLIFIGVMLVGQVFVIIIFFIVVYGWDLVVVMGQVGEFLEYLVEVV